MARDFEGKFTVRTCGRDECQFVAQGSTGPAPGRPRFAIGKRGLPVQIYMSMDLYQTISQIAEDEQLSLSKAATGLLQKGLKIDSKVRSRDFAPDNLDSADSEPTEW